MTKAPSSVRMARHGVLPGALTPAPIPNFWESAACRGSDPELFFSDREGHIAAAKSVCSRCPLMRNCALWAIRFEEYGVFGGLSAKERVLLRGAKPALDPQEQEIALQEVTYILRASVKEVAVRFGVETRTVARWRKLLEQARGVI